MFTGGDILNNDGSGSISIYGDTFPDENLKVNGTKPGFVGMANSGWCFKHFILIINMEILLTEQPPKLS